MAKVQLSRQSLVPRTLAAPWTPSAVQRVKRRRVLGTFQFGLVATPQGQREVPRLLHNLERALLRAPCRHHAEACLRLPCLALVPCQDLAHWGVARDQVLAGLALPPYQGQNKHLDC